MKLLVLSFVLLIVGCASTKKVESGADNSSDRGVASSIDCGPHPFFPGKRANVKFSKHGFVLNSVGRDQKGYYALATHFSNNTARHYFNAMIKARLDENEYLAAVAALEEHPGKKSSKHQGRFSPFLFMSSRPIRGSAPNDRYGFCMKDFVKITQGEKKSLYPSRRFEDNNLYGNLRKWSNIDPNGIFFRYDLDKKDATEGKHDPVITFEPGDIEIIFYDAFKK